MALLMLTMAVSAQNYSFFENDVRFTDVETVSFTHFGEFAITENFGFTDYASTQNSKDMNHAKYGSYSQLLLGVYCKAIPNVTTSVFMGKESISNDIRMAGFVSYIPSDKILAYAFYQRNLNQSYSGSEFYDIKFRYAPFSTEKSSVYIGARYMTTYGLGMPLAYRHSMTPTSNVYVAYTTYYDCTVVGTTSHNNSARWIPTLSLNFEFL